MTIDEAEQAYWGCLMEEMFHKEEAAIMQNPRFHDVLKSMADIHARKNADYAQAGNPYSNFEQAAVSAGCSVDTVFAVMIGIKLARLAELLGSGKEPNNESIQDSRMDLAVYGALWASYGEGPNEGLF